MIWVTQVICWVFSCRRGKQTKIRVIVVIVVVVVMHRTITNLLRTLKLRMNSSLSCLQVFHTPYLLSIDLNCMYPHNVIVIVIHIRPRYHNKSINVGSILRLTTSPSRREGTLYDIKEQLYILYPQGTSYTIRS